MRILLKGSKNKEILNAGNYRATKLETNFQKK